MVHNALPRQLMPRAVTEVALHTMEKRALRRMLIAFGGRIYTNLIVKVGEISCHTQKTRIVGVIYDF